MPKWSYYKWVLWGISLLALIVQGLDRKHTHSLHIFKAFLLQKQAWLQLGQWNMYVLNSHKVEDHQSTTNNHDCLDLVSSHDDR